MNNEKEPASEAKERIEREAITYVKQFNWRPSYQDVDSRKDYIAGAVTEYNRAQEEITRLKAELERERENVLYEASEYFQEFGDRERFTSLQVQQVLMSLIKTN